MKTLRAVLGRLDPWAALLLGVFVTLAVVIILATPGPWQEVVGVSRPGGLASSPPSDAAVFVLGSSDGECTGVLWVHADHQRVSLTVTVLPPLLQAPVVGGGYVPLNRIVDDLGPAAATAALETVLDVKLDMGVALDRKALGMAVPPLFSAGDSLAQRRLTRQGQRAWSGATGPSVAWQTQYETLRAVLPRVALSEMNVVAFANYILGFGPIQNDLDLQSVTTLARMLKGLSPGSIRVRACPAMVDVCRGGEAWNLDALALRDLSHTLRVGLTPPERKPTIEVRRRDARVLVVVPNDDMATPAYVAEARRRLTESSGAPVDVRVVTAKPQRLLQAVRSSVNEWRPLAVLIAPGAVGGQGEKTETKELADATAFLVRRGQPAVVSLPNAGDVGSVSSASVANQLTAVAESSGLPVSRWTDGAGRSVAKPDVARVAARANVETLVRACWSGALAPRLASTRSGFSFAAAREVPVAVRSRASAQAERTADRLRLWGYDAASLAAAKWRPPQPGEALYYREGMERPALALGGDLGLRRNQIVADDSAPADLTLALRE